MEWKKCSNIEKEKGPNTRKEKDSSQTPINVTKDQEAKMQEISPRVRNIPTRKTRTTVQLDRPIPRRARHRALRF